MKPRTKGLLIVGSVILLGAGVYFISNTIKKRKEEDRKLEEEIEAMNKEKREEKKFKDKLAIDLQRWFGWKEWEKKEQA